MKNKILNWLTEYKEKTKCKGVILGISGGKDSTVVAMLSKLVFGDEVLGVIMPNGIQSDIDDAIKVCETLNITHMVVNIQESYNAIIDQIKHVKISDKAKTNIPPRLRMTTLYAIAQTLGYRVIGTGNASERYIGWFTKYGDGGCDLNPIAHLTCTEVIELGKELCEEFKLPIDLVVKKPADGLTGKSDEENFGFTYKRLDDYIRLVDGSGNLEIDEKIEKLHKYSEHKLKMPYTLLDDSGKLID
jgi:NAD+ synthase